MSLESFLLMRHELLLIAIALIVLIAEIAMHDKEKKGLIPFVIILFAIHTFVGFLPEKTGNLFGEMFRSSQLTLLMKNILNIGVLIVLIQSAEWLKKPENKEKISEFFIILFSTLIGMYFMISAGHFVMFFIGIETATIPLAVLAAYEKSKNKSAEAGVKLVLMAALSTGISLYGVSMIYGTSGTLYFSELTKLFASSPLQTLGFIFFFSGMAFKISIVPFHFWTPDVYEGAPINVTSYLSVISKGAAVFIFTIVLFTVFSKIISLWQDVIYVSSVLTMTLANLFAIRQKNLKRFLAFSSIAQAGFIFLGIIGGSTLGMASVIYFVLIYIFSNLGAFGVISIISNKTGKENMDDYDGLYKTNPKLSLAMMLSLFSLAGIPPVAGFFGKFFLFTAAAQQGFYLLVFIGVLNTIISLYYYLLIVKAMFINKNDNPIAYFKSDNYSKVSLIMCIGGMVITGFASVIFEYIKNLSFGV